MALALLAGFHFMRRFLLWGGAATWLLAACQPAKPKPKLDGIVLFIADGTSQELITAARIYAKGVEGHLALENMPETAIVRTYSDSSIVTDSGAAATAMSRGIKADNRVLGIVGPHSKDGPPSILDLAKQAGWSTGVLSDDAVEGATPAAFIVEHGNRDEYFQVASKIADHMGSRVDVLLGGGSKWLSDRVSDPAVVYGAGEREIARATAEKLKAGNVAVFDSWKPFQEFADRGGDGRPALATFFPEEFPYYADGLRTLRLRNMVEEAVKLLRARGKPFLLIAEAGLPDKACHLNNAKRAIAEVLEFDDTIAWMQQNLGPNVLILATTDHYTGGLAINGYPPRKFHADTILLKDGATGQSILTWASGPGAEQAAANTRTRIVREPRKPFRQVMEQKQETDFDYAQPTLLFSKGALHTGGDVWLLGAGPGSEKVRGYMDNTQIFHLMADALAGTSVQ